MGPSSSVPAPHLFQLVQDFRPLLELTERGELHADRRDHPPFISVHWSPYKGDLPTQAAVLSQ